MNDVIKDLPSSWALVKLGDFVENEKGKKPKNESSVKTETHQIPYVDIQAFEENVVRSWTDGVGCRMCYESDFLMVWDGSRSGLVGNGMNGALGSTLVRINFPSMVNKYAYYFLQSKYQQINTRAKGSGTPHVDPDLLWNYNFPIPPISEQHRIVAKIEELFSELDQGIANLKTAQAQLKVFRQALLKHAFEGKLTAEWRVQNADKLESVSALQQCMQQTREKRYQQKFSEWGTNGKQSSKPKAPKPITPLTVEELAELPKLPEGWGWLNVKDFSDHVTDGEHITPKRTQSGYYLLSARNIQNGYLDLGDVDYVPLTEYERIRKRCNPEEGDILISCSGSVGRVCRVPKDIDSVMVRSVALIKLQSVKRTSRFYEYLFQSPILQKQIEKGKKATAQANLFLEPINNLKIVICSEVEQEQIMFKLDSIFSESVQLDQIITASLQQAEALRQSILKKAFSGELVPQNTADEPASKLLERIRAEKVAQALLSKAKVSKPKPVKENVIIFPVKVPYIEVTELHAGLMALAYRQHERSRRTWYFGHVKAEKISHMIESCIGIDLERMPIQDAAGPNDFKRLLAVEAFARQQLWFDVKKQQNGRHLLNKLSGFDALIRRTEAALGHKLESVNALIKLFVSLDTKRSEIVATLFAAWNNLLLLAHKPSDNEIVLEARDRWHEDKLNISKERFDRCLIWMRKHGLVPVGRGYYVPKQNQRNVPKRFKAELENDFMQASNANKGSIK
jgi:type I restriction enzyme, S subunit